MDGVSEMLTERGAIHMVHTIRPVNQPSNVEWEQCLAQGIVVTVIPEKESGMNQLARRTQILDDFKKESKGSFSAVYRAMIAASKDAQSSKLKEEDVKKYIRKIIEEEKAG